MRSRSAQNVDHFDKIMCVDILRRVGFGKNFLNVHTVFCEKIARHVFIHSHLPFFKGIITNYTEIRKVYRANGEEFCGL